MYRKKATRKRQTKPKFLMLLLLAVILFAYLQINHNPVLFGSSMNQTAFASEANQNLNGSPTPLILQTDEQWADAAYGFGEGENTLRKNGCGIVSLAMILSYWDNRLVTPTEILNWAQDNYYMEGAGTAWTIFPDFATQYGLNCWDLGNDLGTAQTYLTQGIPVVASVTAGTFTTGGHIMVLRNWDETGITVNDPNDSAEKNHYQQSYDPTLIASESINYWVFTR